MKLYFSPLACSLSARIALYEAAACEADMEPVEYVEVDTRTQRAADGSDYRSIHGLGQVPALRLANDELITENAAILQYIAARYPRARLAPTDPAGRARLQQCLSFIGAELHKSVYAPLLDRHANEQVQAYALAKAEPRLGWLSEQLADKPFLLADFSVADAYLASVLNWSSVTAIDLGRWPALAAYVTRLHARPSVARALTEELELYRRQRERAGLTRLGTRELMDRWSAAFINHDPEDLESLIASDCVIDSTHPSPDGSLHQGRAACLALWSSLARAPDVRFELEDVLVLGERAIISWRLLREGAAPLRGVNLMRTRAGQIVEARGYVKGS